MAKAHHTIPTLSRKDIVRFWSKVDIRGPEECWTWKAGRFPSDYSIFALNHHLTLRSHRVAYFLSQGDLFNQNLCVLHSCDNPPCCNFDHLYQGTNAENSADMTQKNRQATGEHQGTYTHPESRKRGEEWYKIHPPKSRARGEKHGSHTHPELLKCGEKHWTNQCPESIARGERHGTKTHPEKVRYGEQNHAAKLTVQDVIAIRSQYIPGQVTSVFLAHKYGVRYQIILDIVKHKTWPHI